MTTKKINYERFDMAGRNKARQQGDSLAKAEIVIQTLLVHAFSADRPCDEATSIEAGA